MTNPVNLLDTQTLNPNHHKIDLVICTRVGAWDGTAPKTVQHRFTVQRDSEEPLLELWPFAVEAANFKVCFIFHLHFHISLHLKTNLAFHFLFRESLKRHLNFICSILEKQCK